MPQMLDSDNNPSLPGESFGDYLQRLQSGVTTDQAQQAANDQAQRDQAATAKAYSSQGIASFTDSTGAIQAIKAVPGGPPLQGDGSNGGLVYGQDGSPQRVTFPSLDSPKLVDAYSPEGGGSTQTDKSGNTYATSPGAAWKWTGTDPTVQAQAQADAQDQQFREQKSALDEASGVYGSQVTAAKQALAGHQKALDANTAALQGIPELAGGDFDPDADDAATKLPTAFAPTSPEANEHIGWFGGGGLSQAAQSVRADLANRQQQAQALLAERQARQQAMDAVQNQHDTAQQRLDAVTQQRAALAKQRLQGDGLNTGDDDFDAAQAAANAPAGTANSQTGTSGNTPATVGTAGTPDASQTAAPAAAPAAPLAAGDSVLHTDPNTGITRPAFVRRVDPNSSAAVIRFADQDASAGDMDGRKIVPVAQLQRPAVDPSTQAAPAPDANAGNGQGQQPAAPAAPLAAGVPAPLARGDSVTYSPGDGPARTGTVLQTQPGMPYAIVRHDADPANGLPAQNVRVPVSLLQRPAADPTSTTPGQDASTTAAANDLTRPMPGESPDDFSARQASVRAARAAATQAGQPSPTQPPAPKPYSVGSDGSLSLAPTQMADGLLAANRDGLVPNDKLKALLPGAISADNAAQAQAALQQRVSADDWAKAKAFATGATRGSLFAAAAIPGAEAGAVTGAELGSIAGPIGSAAGTFLGGAIGGLATGYAGSKVASAVGNELAQHSDTIKSFADASQALPQYDAAGNLVSMVVPGAAGLVNLGRVGAIRAAEMGIPAALKLTAKEAGAQAASGAAFEGVIRPTFDWVLQQGKQALGIGGDPNDPNNQVQAPTLSSIAQNAILGVALGNVGTKFKGYDIPDLIELAKKPMSELTPAEVDAVRAAGAKIQEASQRQGGIIGDPNDFKIKVQQAINAGTNTTRAISAQISGTEPPPPIAGLLPGSPLPSSPQGDQPSGIVQPKGQIAPVGNVPAPPSAPAAAASLSGTSSASPSSTAPPATGQAQPPAPAQDDQRQNGQPSAPSAPAADSALTALIQARDGYQKLLDAGKIAPEAEESTRAQLDQLSRQISAAQTGQQRPGQVPPGSTSPAPASPAATAPATPPPPVPPAPPALRETSSGQSNASASLPPARTSSDVAGSSPSGEPSANLRQVSQSPLTTEFHQQLADAVNSGAASQIDGLPATPTFRALSMLRDAGMPVTPDLARRVDEQVQAIKNDPTLPDNTAKTAALKRMVAGIVPAEPHADTGTDTAPANSAPQAQGGSDLQRTSPTSSTAPATTGSAGSSLTVGDPVRLTNKAGNVVPATVQGISPGGDVQVKSRVGSATIPRAEIDSRPGRLVKAASSSAPASTLAAPSAPAAPFQRGDAVVVDGRPGTIQQIRPDQPVAVVHHDADPLGSGLPAENVRVRVADLQRAPASSEVAPASPSAPLAPAGGAAPATRQPVTPQGIHAKKLIDTLTASQAAGRQISEHQQGALADARTALDTDLNSQVLGPNRQPTTVAGKRALANLQQMETYKATGMPLKPGDYDTAREMNRVLQNDFTAQRQAIEARQQESQAPAPTEPAASKAPALSQNEPALSQNEPAAPANSSPAAPLVFRERQPVVYKGRNAVVEHIDGDRAVVRALAGPDPKTGANLTATRFRNVPLSALRAKPTAAPPTATEQPFTAAQALATAQAQINANRAMLKGMGVTDVRYGPTVASSGVEIGGDGILKINAAKLANSMTAVRANRANLGTPGTAEEWFSQVLVHEGIHAADAAVARAKGQTIQQRYEALPDAAMPAGWQDAGRQVHGAQNWEAMPEWQRKAEFVRQVVENRWTGKITEALHRFIKEALDFLKGVAGFKDADPRFQAHVEEVETRIAAASQGQGGGSTTAPRPGGRVAYGRRAAVVQSIDGDTARIQLKGSGKTIQVPVADLKPPIMRRFVLPSTATGQPDIIDHIAENGGMRGSEAAKRIAAGKGLTDGVGGDYDDRPDLKPGVYTNALFGGQMTPDQMASALHEDYGHGDGTTPTMYRLVDQAMRSRESEREEMQRQATVEKQASNFDRDALTQGTAKGGQEINAGDLSVGDKVQVGNQTLKVIDVDPDLNVTLEDHSKYGKQTVADGQSLYVEKIDPATGSDGASLAASAPAATAGLSEKANPLAKKRAAQLWARQGTDSPYFKQWFGDSKVVDATGKPLVVYHGSPALVNGRGFDAFHVPASAGDLLAGSGVYLTDSKPIAQSYTLNRDELLSGGSADAKNVPDSTPVLPLYANIRKPFQAGDAGMADARAIVAAELAKQPADPPLRRRDGTVIQPPSATERAAQAVDNAARLYPPSDPLRAYEVLRDALSDEGVIQNARTSAGDQLRDVLQAHGFDGIAHEGGVQGGQKHQVFVAFDPAQVKSAEPAGSPRSNSGAFDPGNPSFLAASRPDTQTGDLFGGSDDPFNLQSELANPAERVAAAKAQANRPPAAAAPTLRAGEKGTGDLFQGDDQPFNLAGETAIDYGARQTAREQAERATAEATALQDRQQGSLFAPADSRLTYPDGLFEKGSADNRKAQLLREAYATGELSHSPETGLWSRGPKTARVARQLVDANNERTLAEQRAILDGDKASLARNYARAGNPKPLASLLTGREATLKAKEDALARFQAPADKSALSAAPTRDAGGLTENGSRNAWNSLGRAANGEKYAHLQPLVQAASPESASPADLGATYLRMLAQRRAGLPLTESGSRDTSALEQALDGPQPKMAEAALAKMPPAEPAAPAATQTTDPAGSLKDAAPDVRKALREKIAALRRGKQGVSPDLTHWLAKLDGRGSFMANLSPEDESGAMASLRALDQEHGLGLDLGATAPTTADPGLMAATDPAEASDPLTESLFGKGTPAPAPTSKGNFFQRARVEMARHQANGKLADTLSAHHDAVDTMAGESGRQAKNSVRLDIPDALDRQAAGPVVEAGGDRARLAADLAKVKASPDPKLVKQYAPIYQRALDNLPRLNTAADGYRQMDVREDAAAERAGLTPQWQARTKHLYDDPTSPESTIVPDKGFGATKGYKTAADAIAAGVDPKSTDLADLAEKRVYRNQRAINEQAFQGDLASMKASDGKPLVSSIEESGTKLNAAGDPVPSAKVPAGYKTVQAGNNVLVVHPDAAPVLQALYGESAIRQNKLGNAALDLAALIKHTAIGVDTYHGFQVAMRSILGFQVADYRSGLAGRDYADADLDRAVKAGKITQAQADDARANRHIDNGLLAEGLNVGKVADNLLDSARQHNLIAHLPILGKAAIAVNNLTFHAIQPGYMKQAGRIAYARNKARFPELSEQELFRRSAKEVNEFYGSLGSQGVFKSKTMSDAARLIGFAPQFAEGRFRTEARGFAQAAKAPVDAAMGKGFRVGVVAQAMASVVLASLIGNQVLNLFTKGKPTWENEDGHRWDAWIPGGAHNRGFYFSPLSMAAEYSHELYKYISGGQSALDAVGHIASNKLSGLGRAVKDLATGTDYRGQPYGSMSERLKAAALELSPVPMQAGAVIKKDPKALLGYSLNGEPGAGEKQLFASAGMKLENAKSPRSQMYQIAQAFKKPGTAGGQHAPSEYSGLRQALDNQDRAGAQDEIRQLLRAGKSLPAIGKALGLRNGSAAEVQPEHFTGSAAGDRQMFAKLTPAQRAIYQQAQRDRGASARLFAQWAPPLMASDPEVRKLAAANLQQEQQARAASSRSSAAVVTLTGVPLLTALPRRRFNGGSTARSLLTR